MERRYVMSKTSVRWVCLFDEKHSNYQGRNLLLMPIFIVKLLIRNTKIISYKHSGLNVSFGIHLTNKLIEIIFYRLSQSDDGHCCQRHPAAKVRATGAKSSQLSINRMQGGPVKYQHQHPA